eukprot:SAG11_NODE_1100_length_5869_cov_8.279896_1_plen_295_part_00
MSAASSEHEYQDVAAPKGAPEPELEAEDAAEPAPEKLWWEEVCRDIAAGRSVDAVRAGLAVQQQAQAYATEERLAAEAAAKELAAERSAAEGHLLQALETRDRRIADLESNLQKLVEAKDDPEPEHREFCARAANNPFGTVSGAERAGSKAEPQLRFYNTEKAFVFLEEKGDKAFYNFQVLESAAEALFDVTEALKLNFPLVVEKVNPEGEVDEESPQYAVERELCKIYNTVKATYDNVINPQLSYLQVEAILHKKYGGGQQNGWITIHGLIDPRSYRNAHAGELCTKVRRRNV